MWRREGPTLVRLPHLSGTGRTQVSAAAALKWDEAYDERFSPRLLLQVAPRTQRDRVKVGSRLCTGLQILLIVCRVLSVGVPKAGPVWHACHAALLLYCCYTLVYGFGDAQAGKLLL